MKKIILISLLISFTVPAFSQFLSGDLGNTKMDLSGLGPDNWTSMAVYEFEGVNVTLGIAAKEAKGGIVKIDNKNRVITTGAGIFAGNEEHKWPSARVIFVKHEGDIYKDMGISGTCTNIYYKGIVLEQIMKIEKSNGKYPYYVAEPIEGKFDNFNVDNKATNVLSESERDFGDGYLNSEEFGQIKVLIVSSIKDVSLIFIVGENPTPEGTKVDEDSTPDDMKVDKNISLLNYLLTPIGLVVSVIFIILLILGIIFLRTHKRKTKK